MAVEVLVVKTLAPLYTAVIECVPSVSPDVVKVAWAVDDPGMSLKPGLRMTVPSTVLPSWNVTVPVGAAPPLVLTVAVSATAWPGAEFVNDEDSVVVVLLAGCIDSRRASEVLPA